MADHRSDTYWLLGCLLKFHARHSGTGGTCTVVEGLIAPGAGAPPNRHAGEAESFYVLDGTFEFTVEGETIPLGAGGFLAVPDGAVHAFCNSGEAPARLLIYNTPGRVHEEFYSLCGQAQPVGATMFPENAPEPDIGAIIETGKRAGIVFVQEGAPA